MAAASSGKRADYCGKSNIHSGTKRGPPLNSVEDVCSVVGVVVALSRRIFMHFVLKWLSHFLLAPLSGTCRMLNVRETLFPLGFGEGAIAAIDRNSAVENWLAY